MNTHALTRSTLGAVVSSATLLRQFLFGSFALISKEGDRGRLYFGNSLACVYNHKMMLECVDGSGTIDLPAGLTTIGRGPLLGVLDKRVSRNHGLLDVLDGKLRIKPIHINPCFHRSSSGDQLLPLEKDKWHWLNPGECFSLMPDKYIYKVISSSSDQTLRNSDLSSLEDDQFDSEHLQKGKGKFEKVSEDYTENLTTSSKTITRDSKEKFSTFEPNNILENMSRYNQLKNGSAPLNPVQRKRVLPAWMLQAAQEVQSTSSVNKPDKGRGRSKGISDAERMKTEITQRERKRNESFVKENEASDQPLEKKGRRKKAEATETEQHTLSKSNSKENNFGTNSTCVKRKENKNKFSAPFQSEEKWKLDAVEGRSRRDCSPQQLHETSNWAVSDKEEEGEEVELLFRPDKQEELQCKHMQGPHSKSSSPGPEEPGLAGGASTSHAEEDKRRACVYGSNCYRKNPVHFQEFSHPGDADYEDPLAGGEEDDKPQCPFGTACYRKNPQHKKEYKHTQPPESTLRRPRRKVAQKGKSALGNDNDSDGPNQYDLNDSFIDDEEDDLDPTDEDSDWEPSSDGNEDIDTLREEANRFINK
ncbi:aprataxin and PNK-like factor isoform X2 [Narcine bancroftii]|uniref:aprataxin and PNK-like factor isoform X2 n=1 Tax=Narcine bancroftii TaxID=1343680 RepID=UPI0038313638